MSTLLIVESAGKIKKIKSLLGDGYNVMASVGHIIDLEEKNISVDVNNKFEPKYAIMKGKDDVVKNLRKAAKNADNILLATDEDREGEMIAWSLAYMLNIKNPKRITFNSITKSELEKAVKNPRAIDMNLVDAQKGRRVLDRIVGYEISPILWKSIQASLSAGRVQSVVAKIIIDKENEIKDFMQKGANSYFKFNGTFLSKKKPFESTLVKLKDEKKTKKNKSEKDKDVSKEELSYQKAVIDSESDARILIKNMMKSTFTVEEVAKKDTLRNPSPPFTTSTLQQEAARKLGFAVKRTMNAAQNLYESGFITYMRTDSVTLSKDAMDNISKYVLKKFGKEYFRPKNYEAKTKNTQEAHEAVRPVDCNVEVATSNGKDKIGSDEIKLYSLIWKRAVASQMSPAKINITNIAIDISKVNEYKFVSQLQNIEFPGFLTVYNIKNVEKEDKVNEDGEEEISEEDLVSIEIPKVGTKLDPKEITSMQDYERPPPRYNEASLINKLDPKNLNIGRPSTYASIITKIQERGYVKMQDMPGLEKDSVKMIWDGGAKLKEEVNKLLIGKENNKLVPTSMGILVNEFLVKNFPEIMDYQFTAKMEDSLDDVAEGKIAWYKVLDKFYKKFHPIIEELKTKKSTLIEDMSRLIGKHPTLEHEIYATMAKYGPVIKMCTSKTKCIYAPIKEPLTRETITLKDALKLLEYPKEVGKLGHKMITLHKGKFGLYIKWGDTQASIENNELVKDPEEITLEEATAVIKDKRKNILYEGEADKVEYTILIGPYGKFINVKDRKKKLGKPINVPAEEILKDMTNEEIAKLSIEKIQEFVKIGLENKFKRRKQKTEEKMGNKTSPQARTKKSVIKKGSKKSVIKKGSKKPSKKGTKTKVKTIKAIGKKKKDEK